MKVDRARGRLERCELWDNEYGGVKVKGGGNPTLTACTIRNHVLAGVFINGESNATVGTSCIFARNSGGDVVRE